MMTTRKSHPMQRVPLLETTVHASPGSGSELLKNNADFKKTSCTYKMNRDFLCFMHALNFPRETFRIQSDFSQSTPKTWITRDGCIYFVQQVMVGLPNYMQLRTKTVASCWHNLTKAFKIIDNHSKATKRLPIHNLVTIGAVDKYHYCLSHNGGIPILIPHSSSIHCILNKVVETTLQSVLHEAINFCKPITKRMKRGITLKWLFHSSRKNLTLAVF